MAADSIRNTHYISQGAANAIIAGVAPYRISSEALQAINTFLDKFLYILVDAAHSLEFVRIKSAIGTVLPTSVGKDAVLEAELELKTYVESGNSDSTKEKTIEITPFPLQKVFEQFRVKCQYFSTLGERGSEDRHPYAVPDLYGAEGIHIAPSLAIYLTAVLEYLGEYVLIRVAKMSERQRVEVARAKEVYLALSEDSQISQLFRRMNLETESNYRSGGGQSSAGRTSLDSGKSPRPANLLPKHSQNGSAGKRPSFDGLGTTGGFKRTSTDLKSPRSIKSMQSLSSSGERESSDIRSVSSTEDNYEKGKNFEQLISSNQTMKVSLTPNRLITIETHNRPPKLAPRDPVSRERIIPVNGNNKFDDGYDSDDDLYPQKGRRKEKEESLYEFLKNTSPDDIFGNKSKNRPPGKDLHVRRGKSIDKLESVPERPSSPGSKPRYTPIIPPVTLQQSKSLPTSPANNALNITGQTFGSTLSPYTNKQASKSTGYLQPGSVGRVRPRPGPLDLDDDDNPKPKRRHQAQDLMDFLATTPPGEMATFPTSVHQDLDGKKKEGKIMKLFGRWRKTSFSEESSSSSSYEQRTNASVNSFGTTSTYVSTTTNRTLTNRPPRYIKIEIPQLPKQEEKLEASIFDQIEIQGRHARHLSKKSSITKSPQSTPKRSTFTPSTDRVSTTVAEGGVGIAAKSVPTAIKIPIRDSSISEHSPPVRDSSLPQKQRSPLETQSTQQLPNTSPPTKDSPPKPPPKKLEEVSPPVPPPKKSEKILPLTPPKKLEEVSPVPPPKKLEEVPPLVSPPKKLEEVSPPVPSSKKSEKASPVPPTKKLEEVSPVPPPKKLEKVSPPAPPPKKSEKASPVPPPKKLEEVSPPVPSSKKSEKVSPVPPPKKSEEVSPPVPSSKKSEKVSPVPPPKKSEEVSPPIPSSKKLKEVSPIPPPKKLEEVSPPVSAPKKLDKVQRIQKELPPQPIPESRPIVASTTIKPMPVVSVVSQKVSTEITTQTERSETTIQRQAKKETSVITAETTTTEVIVESSTEEASEITEVSIKESTEEPVITVDGFVGEVAKQMLADESKEIEVDESKEIKVDESKEIEVDESKEIEVDESKETEVDESKEIEVDEEVSVIDESNEIVEIEASEEEEREEALVAEWLLGTAFGFMNSVLQDVVEFENFSSDDDDVVVDVVNNGGTYDDDDDDDDDDDHFVEAIDDPVESTMEVYNAY